MNALVDWTSDEAVEIAAMRVRDLRAVMAVERQSPTSSWSKSMFLSELGAGNRCYLVVKLDGAVVGFAGLIAIAGEGHISNIGVDTEVRRNGFGSHLMIGLAEGALELDCDCLTLEVGVTNHQAQGLYTRFGFAPSGVRKNYYSTSGEDALIMWASDIDGEDYATRIRDIGAKLERTRQSQ